VAAGNFSNGGVDTFDATKRYIGIRLQQGVPLLDRDWNELEDIRRHQEWLLRTHHIGEGAFDEGSLKVEAADADRDVLLRAGRYCVAGFDVVVERDLLFSEQGAKLPLPPADEDDVLVLYVEPRIERVTAEQDSTLANGQDVNIETAVRDRLDCSVSAVRRPTPIPAGAAALAEITRPKGSERITAAMIADLRRRRLSLADSVDRLVAVEERLDALEDGFKQTQVAVASVRQDIARLFWDVAMEASDPDALFGEPVTITVVVTDRDGRPVPGALAAVSSDWGSVSPRAAATDAEGRMQVEIMGVAAQVHPSPGDIAVLLRAARRIRQLRVSGGGTVDYSGLRFTRQEIAVLSRYQPPGTLVDLVVDVPTGAIVARPAPRVATVTVHVREPNGTTVRGVGSVQVAYGLWLRDWALTRVFDVLSSVKVSSRIGALIRRGVAANNAFQLAEVTKALPRTLQLINDETHALLRETLFTDAATGAVAAQGGGAVGQAIAEAVSAAVGARTERAINQQIDQFADSEVQIDADAAEDARAAITQTTSTLQAGFTQSARQLFATPPQGT
jgi:hypothetical protein